MVYEWSFNSSLPRNSSLLQRTNWNMMGHRLTVITLPYFPFIEAERDSDQPGTTLTPRDSVDIRMINTFAAHLNYTYELREPLDGNWGMPQANGSWTGIVGSLQRQQGDFSVCLWMTEERIQIIDHTRVYSQDPLTIVSLGSYRFSQYLSLIKPFTRRVWLLLLLSLVVWGTALWLLQRAWSRVFSRRGLTLSTALFYGWAVLLEDPPTYSPANTSGRVRPLNFVRNS
ncbi:glutamate receptor ionotropic, kainate 5-like [Panulirus ornatus]|uniref:glutamate receptor ionotropic, kainate 5-like n=1 Tax=Panulirus ornatus TaxID=150431 RepID=UPI003A8873C4